MKKLIFGFILLFLYFTPSVFAVSINPTSGSQNTDGSPYIYTTVTCDSGNYVYFYGIAKARFDTLECSTQSPYLASLGGEGKGDTLPPYNYGFCELSQAVSTNSISMWDDCLNNQYYLDSKQLAVTYLDAGLILGDNTVRENTQGTILGLQEGLIEIFLVGIIGGSALLLSIAVVYWILKHFKSMSKMGGSSYGVSKDTSKWANIDSKGYYKINSSGKKIYGSSSSPTFRDMVNADTNQDPTYKR